VKSSDEVLDGRILKPLGMQRTTIGAKFQHVGNVAKQYRALNDKTPLKLERPSVRSGSLFVASGEMKSLP
jgi:CubicO group peptidase (beta-lactamase class C family)